MATARKRSGFQNHLRAYNCNQNCYIPPLPPLPPVPPCSITYINLSDIATYNSNTNRWVLNNNTTITSCQVLIIPNDPTLQAILQINGLELVNNGVIYSQSIDDPTNVVGIEIFNNGSLINNNIFKLGNTDFGIDTNGQFINNGYFSHRTYFYIQSSGKVENYGRFINRGYLDIMVNSTFNNYGIIETIYISNSNLIIKCDGGTLINHVNGKIYNSTDSTIYNVNNGMIINEGYFENNGIINNADGTSSCGTATITGIISGNPPGNSCP